MMQKEFIKKNKKGNFKPKGRQVSPKASKEIRMILGENNLERSLLIEYLYLIQDKYNCLSHLLRSGTT